MGRKKLCADALREREQERKETFNKRCRGLFKKAHELASMCGCEVQLCVQGEDGRLYHLHRLRHPSLSSAASAAAPPSSPPASSAPPTSPTSSSSSSPPPIPPSRKTGRLFYNPLTFKMENCPPDFPPSDPPLLFLPSSPCPCFDCTSGRSSSHSPALLSSFAPETPSSPFRSPSRAHLRPFLHPHHLFLPPSPVPANANGSANVDATVVSTVTSRPSFILPQDPLTFDATDSRVEPGGEYPLLLGLPRNIHGPTFWLLASFSISHVHIILAAMVGSCLPLPCPLTWLVHCFVAHNNKQQSITSCLGPCMSMLYARTFVPNLYNFLESYIISHLNSRGFHVGEEDKCVIVCFQVQYA